MTHSYKHITHQQVSSVTSIALAARTDFLVLCVVRRHRAFRCFLTSSESEEIGRNVHSYSFQFSRTKFFAGQPKDADQNLGRGNRSLRPTCRPTYPIFSFEKLRQHFRRGNRCM